jgi:hypothetical protein
MATPVAAGRLRAWVALLLSLAGLVVLPAAVELSRRSARVTLLEAGYAIPVAFLLGLVGLVMARRARQNVRWLRIRGGGTAVASTALVVGLITVCLTVTAALSIGFYELVLLYERSR